MSRKIKQYDLYLADDPASGSGSSTKNNENENEGDSDTEKKNAKLLGNLKKL